MPTPFQIPNQQQYMPGAAPTAAAPQESAGGGSDIESLRARLIQYVEDMLDEEEPQAPQMQAPRALRPWEAAAAALNPQQAGHFTGRAADEATAQNQTATMAFEQAMGRRKEALGMAGDILRPQPGMRFQDTSGFKPDVKQYRDERGNIFLGVATVGTQGMGEMELVAADPNGPQQPIGRIVPVNPAPSLQDFQGGKKWTDPRFANMGGGGGGGGIGGVVDQPKPSAGDVDTTSNIGNLLSRIRAITQSAVIQPGGPLEFGARVGQEVGRRVPIVGPRLSGRIDPRGEGFARDTEYIRSQMQLILTGKQVNETEIRRLLAMIPDLADATNPQFYLSQMQKFEDQFANVLQRQAQLRPDLFTASELQEIGGGGGGDDIDALADEMGL